MRTWAHWTAKTVMLTATFAAAGAGLPGAALAAPAGGGGSASGLGSVLGGNQASAPISAPGDVCGSAVAVLGLGLAGCRGGAPATGTSAGASGGSVSPATSGNGSAGGGNQIGAPLVGWVADTFGPRWALMVGAASGFAAVAVAFRYLAKHRGLKVRVNRGRLNFSLGPGWMKDAAAPGTAVPSANALRLINP